MSGVGVITERFIPDDDLLYYDPTERTSSSISFENTNSRGSSTNGEDGEEEEEEEQVEEEKSNVAMSVNCPCYEKAFEKDHEKLGLFKNIFASI